MGCLSFANVSIVLTDSEKGDTKGSRYTACAEFLFQQVEDPVLNQGKKFDNKFKSYFKFLDPRLVCLRYIIPFLHQISIHTLIDINLLQLRG
ncbi:hypothetical protein SRCM100730_04084 [Bacillus velezensis]|uniref:Uncharacterized protein n=1 Tax=Bacillus velezensis TaxID=492670 RepID=A0A7W4QF67_BACVE|nr:hypothetical protein S101413_04492 [Bacillus velezensis]OBR31459.1 hypothetical protein SRCM100731_02674 [Bacillus velezensis]OCB92424.1 hypothetical protein SRCM100730_04084 [Bacillus velezensis]QOY26714.1 hypothetical protein BACVE_001721 [Bacillus velezensis]